MGQGDPAGREVFIEFIALGDSVRVAAIDAASGVEAVITGPASAAKSDLERLALRKLDAVLTRREEARPHPKPGRGKFI